MEIWHVNASAITHHHLHRHSFVIVIAIVIVVTIIIVIIIIFLVYYIVVSPALSFRPRSCLVFFIHVRVPYHFLKQK